MTTSKNSTQNNDKPKMDIEDTVTAILRTMYEKSTKPNENKEDLLHQTMQRIMLVYHSAFSNTNEELLSYLPPLEHPIHSGEQN